MAGPTNKNSIMVLRFVNQVAQEAAKEYPNRLLTFYSEYAISGPPIDEDSGAIILRAHPMVVPVVTNRFCRIHSMTDDPNVATCFVNGWFKWALDGWSRASRQIYIRDYRMWSRYPSPGTWTVGPLIRYYHNRNAKGYSGEMIARSPDNDLAVYIAARMLWDCGQDPDALVEEFFELYFQEAGPRMRAYYRRLNDTVLKQNERHDDSAFESATVFNRRVVGELSALLRRAEQAAVQAVIKRRVRRERLALTAFDYLMRGERLYMRWNKDKKPRTAQALNALVTEAGPFLDTLSGTYMVADQSIKGHLTTWRKLAFQEQQ